MARPAPRADPRHGRTFGRRTGSPDDVALLARLAAQGQDRGVSRFLVHLADPQPGIRSHQGGRPRPEPGARQAPGKDAHRRRGADHQILAAPVQGKAGKALEDPGERPENPLARHRTRLGALQALRQVPHRPRKRDPPHQHRRGAVDHRRRLRPALPQPDDGQGDPRNHPQAPRRRGQEEKSGSAFRAAAAAFHR